jgi:hypothetical protein
MIIPNNFKEIRITSNEDNTFKIEYYGVIFKDNNGKQLEPATVTYPRVKMKSSILFVEPTKPHIDIEILPDNNDDLQTIYIPEEE